MASASAGTPIRLRLGTRQSALALAQSGQVARALEAARPGLTVSLVPIITEGDRQKGDLAPLGGKGLFTAELEQGLLDGDLDLAVHSLKDLPVHEPDGLTVAAYPKRADPRDSLVSREAETLAALPERAILLTGSLRRRAQLLASRSDLDVRPLRGNVDTRLAKWRDTGAAGVILAAAGLARLGFDGLPAHPLPADRFVPAPGQGTLALQVKKGGRAEEICRLLDDPATARAAQAERAIVAALGGDCTLPLGAWGREAPAGDFQLTACLALPDGSQVARAEATAPEPAEAADLCLERLHQAGADDILATLARSPKA